MSCVPGLLFEMWLFGLAVYRVAAFSKATRRGLPDVLCLLLKDSISWFFIIAVMIVWNIFSLIAAPTGSHTIAIAPFHAAIIVCGCRLIIRMRKSAAEEGHYLEPTNNSGVAHTQNDDVSEWSHDLQDVSFDDRRKKSEDNSARTSDSVKQIETTATAVHNKRPQQHRVIGSGADRSGRASSLDIVAARRFVGIAQKLGLPPALNSDFNALWQEPQSFLDMDDDSPPAEFVQMQRIDVSRRISVVPGPRQPYLMRSSLSRSPELPDMSRKGQSNSLALREEDEDIVFSRPTNPCSGDELHGRHSSLDV
ncbi:hypothetical protein FRB90_000696 [Tulasnella sp. 427]|nr:hypothetical protein FRB90_000696 [Tulasnella sp. 427]